MANFKLNLTYSFLYTVRFLQYDEGLGRLLSYVRAVGMQVRPVLFVGFRSLTTKEIFTVCYLDMLHVLNISHYARHAQSSYPLPKLFDKS